MEKFVVIVLKKTKMSCFNCEMVRACKLCLDLISEKKTHSTDTNILKRHHPNENREILPQYEGVYEPKQNHINFQSAREILMKEDYKMVVKRRFERIKNMMECKSYIENEDISENKVIFFYGFKHVKTDKVGKYVLMGCELDELNEKNKLFNFWAIKILYKEIEMR